MPESRLFEPHLTHFNPYPDCVSLNLKVLPLTVETTASEQLNLELTIRFNEQEKSLLNGQIKFAVKGGKLKLNLKNGQIIEPKRSFNDECQLQNLTPVEAVWQFTPQIGQSYLKIPSISSQLAIIEVMADTYLSVTFEVSPSDVSITQAEGLWRHDIHPNQHSILERVLAQFLWKNRLNPYLSQIKLSLDGLASESSDNQQNQGINPHSLAQLHQTIETIYTSSNHNLLELAQLAQLNPKIDLCGGNFLATELSSIELSGANLIRSNFRGANLTDADLSEAILSYAKFSGADLSGAYLGNAKLNQGDFYRASLALANLIGADLTDANLVEANLSQTNLSGAIVNGAKFGENPGMTEEMAQSLRERGAIFVGNP